MRPTVAAASALWTDRRPSVGIAIGRRIPSARSTKRIPARPFETTPSAPTSASSANPYVVDRAADRAPIRRTIGSSALRTAAPSGGSASSSSPLAASIASIEPMRDRWTGWTAVTTPIRGRAMRASSAISPPTYIPISRTAASCSGPIRSSVRGRPTSLFWLPSLRSVRRREDRTAAIASLVDVLAMLPVTPTTSGSNRRRQPAASAPSAARGSATRTMVTSPNAAGSAMRPGDEQGRGTTRHRVAEERVTVDVLAGERHEHLARLDEP